MIQTVSTKTLRVEIMFNEISDKQYLYISFMHQKSYKRTKFVTLLECGIISWNPFHLGKWYSGDASSMFLLIIVAVENPLFQWAQIRNHLLYDCLETIVKISGW